MKQPSLTDLNAFIAVATHASFRRAADRLDVSHSALSHAIRGLESNLGVRLFNRTTRSVSLTQEGERLLSRLVPLLGELNRTLTDVSDTADEPGGVVRINGGPGAIRLLLDTVVPVFQARYPHVELDLVADGRLIDIVAQGFDAGIRLGDAVPKDMVAIAMGSDVQFLPVASPAYLAGAPPLKTPEDLHQHRCIRQRLPSGKRYRWEFRKQADEMAIDVPGTLTLNNNPLMVEAALSGLGIAYIQDRLARRYIESGELIVVLPDWCPPWPGFCLYFPANRHMPQALRAFVDVVKAHEAARRLGRSRGTA